MARGFESKDVEFQQAEAQRSSSNERPLTGEERDAKDRRKTIELALSKARAEREAATNPRHREMLERTIQALEDMLSAQL